MRSGDFGLRMPRNLGGHLFHNGAGECFMAVSLDKERPRPANDVASVIFSETARRVGVLRVPRKSHLAQITSPLMVIPCLSTSSRTSAILRPTLLVPSPATSIVRLSALNGARPN